MRTVAEFEKDKQQWNRDSDRRYRTKKAINLVVTVVVVVVLAIVGWNLFKKWQADQAANPKPPVTQNQ